MPNASNPELMPALVVLAVLALVCRLAWRATAYRAPTEAEWATLYEWDQRVDPAEPSALSTPPVNPVNDFTDTERARAMRRADRPTRRTAR